MKKIYILGALAVAATALFSCDKEQDFNKVEEPKGIPFEFVAGTVDTKTVNAGVSTTWAADDQISLFHAVKDAEASTAVYDGAFTASAAGASVPFTGTLASALDGETYYDWYAIYPYSTGPKTANAFDYVTIGSAAAGAQVQAGNDSKAHLAGANYPLWGKQKNVAAATKPAITMNQMASIIEVKVTNKTAVDTKVTKVQFSSAAESNLIGEFRVDLSGDAPAFTKSTTNSVATLNVTGADAIAEDEYASFFFAVKPFTATAGSKLTITITTDKGEQESVNIVPSNFKFLAGKIHTLAVNYTNQSLSVAEFKYNDGDWLDVQGITKPAAGYATNLTGTTQTVSPITLTSTDGSTETRIWNKSGNYDMRVYSGGGSFTLSTTGSNLITKIAIADSGQGTSPSFGSNGANISVSGGSKYGTTQNVTWTGLTQDVMFTAGATLNVGTITVFYRAAEASDHVVSLPLTEKNVAYTATSTTFVVKTVNVEDLSISSTSPGYTSHSLVGNTLTVNFEANAAAAPRNIVLSVSSAAAGFDGTITISQAGAPTKINTLTSSSTGVTVTAQVTALTTKGFVLTDDTASILVYTNVTAVGVYTIGQTVTVSGDVSAYNKGLQFNVKDGLATVTAGAAGSYVYPSATAYGLAEVTSYLGDAADRLAGYVQLSGVIKKSGSYFNVIVGGGSTTNVTLYSPISTLTSGLADGDYVTVKGYTTSISSSMIAVCATEVTESDTAPALLFSDITGVAAAGVTNQTHTVTPYRLPGSAPTVTYTGCVSAASINATCTTVTYSVSANAAATPKEGTIVITFTAGGDPYVYTIKVSQEANTLSQTWNLATASHSSATADLVTWSSTPITMTLAKNTSSTAANNYLGGGSKTHTRVYQNQLLTITPTSGKTILSITITATSSDYAKKWNDSTWGNGSASYSGSVVTITPTSGTSAVTCTITAATRATQVKVEYSE